MERLKEIKRLRELAEKYGLEDREVLSRHPMNVLARAYNSIGPTSFPAWLRGCVTALHPSLAAVTFIHNVEWFKSDGPDGMFRETDERFRRNGHKVAMAGVRLVQSTPLDCDEPGAEVWQLLPAARLVRLAQVPSGQAEGRNGRRHHRRWPVVITSAPGPAEARGGKG